MDTDALRWLQQVADGTTVTEVSDAEGVTQSGVSRALARLEASTALARLTGRFPGLALDGEVTWNGRINLRGPAHLPVSLRD